MKIAICSSATFAKKTMETKEELEKIGHEVLAPHNFHLYADGTFAPETQKESTENKIKDDLIRQYYREIENSDAVLVINIDKHGIKNYIGGNVFLEIGFAHVLDKEIFLLNPVPDMLYSGEILAMGCKIINGDLSKIT